MFKSAMEGDMRSFPGGVRHMFQKTHCHIEIYWVFQVIQPFKNQAVAKNGVGGIYQADRTRYEPGLGMFQWCLWDQFVGKYTGLVPMDVLWVYGFMGYGCYGNLKKLIWSLILLRFHQLWADSEDHLRNDPENSKWDEFGCNFFEHPRSHHFWLKCYHPNRPLLKKRLCLTRVFEQKKQET